MKPKTNTFGEFTRQMFQILGGTAGEKGYNTTGPDGPNQLYDFIESVVACGEGHALGEVVYKIVRFRAKSKPEDLVKAAAWAFLVWKKHVRKATRKPKQKKTSAK